MSRKAVFYFFFIMAGGLFLAGGGDRKNEDSAGNTIAVVDLERLYKTSDAARKRDEHLNAVEKTLTGGLDEARRQYAGMPDTEKNALLVQDMKVLRAQWVIEQQRAQQVLTLAVGEAVKIWGEQHQNVRLVLPGRLTLSSDPSLDITEAVLTQLNQMPLTFAPLPVISIRPLSGDGRLPADKTPPAPAVRKR